MNTIISALWYVLQKAVQTIYAILSEMNSWWNVQYRFDAQKRSRLGELMIALSILGSVAEILAPIWGGVPLIISIVLIVCSVLTYWFMRSGISDPRLWDLTLIGIVIQIFGVAIGGLFIAHPELSLLQHLFNNVLVRSTVIGGLSLLGAGIGYVLSALPGMLEGPREPEWDYPVPDLDDPRYGSRWKHPLDIPREWND